MPERRPHNPNRYSIVEDPFNPWLWCMKDSVSGFTSAQNWARPTDYTLTEAIRKLHNEPGEYADEQEYRFFHNFQWRKPDGSLTPYMNFI